MLFAKNLSQEEQKPLSSAWYGKTRGGVAGHAIFIFILKYTHIKIAYFILRFVVVYFMLFAPKAVQTAYSFYRKRLGFEAPKAILFIYRNFFNLGQVIVDKVAMLGGFHRKFSFSFENEPMLHEMIAEGKGGLLISAHVGNWEMAGQMLKRLDTRFKIVMFDAEHKRIKKQLEDVFVEKKNDFILIKDDLSHIFEIKKALDQKEIICIHGDRFLPGSKTITGTFFGSPAKFPLGVFSMAVLLNVPVSFAMAFKETGTHYAFYATPFHYYNTESGTDRQKNTNDILAAYVNNLESLLKKYPAQWFNYYDFWSQE